MHTYINVERWLSGRKRTTRNRLIGSYSWVRIPPSPDFFSVGQFQKHYISVKIFVNTCNNNNYCIFFLKTVSVNVRLIQINPDFFIQKMLVEILVEFYLSTRIAASESTLECLRKSSQLKLLRI